MKIITSQNPGDPRGIKFHSQNPEEQKNTFLIFLIPQGMKFGQELQTLAITLELVSKELNHFGVIAGLFRQIGGHSSRFVLFCSF